MSERTSPVTEGSQLSRRYFLKAAGGLGLTVAGMGLLEACGVKPAATGGTLETTTIRIPLANTISICMAPLYVAETLLKAAGFTNVQYTQAVGTDLSVGALVAGTGDITMQFSGPSMLYLDAGKPVTMLAGVHVGCFVLFGSSQIQQISDLKGKTIAVAQLGGAEHIYLSSMLANVSIDPTKDVTWTTSPVPQTKQLFIDGKIDAILAFPPTAQELQARRIGHVVVNSMMDQPWSDYFCCMVTVSQAFLQKNPVATKAALRAILQATDICALQPERPAKLMVDKGFSTNYEYTLAAMQQIPYNRWRVYNPEDTIRFYALLLRGVGMIKSTPDELIKQGTDWTFLKQLKAELPATPAPAGALAATRNLFCPVPGGRGAGAQQSLPKG